LAVEFNIDLQVQECLELEFNIDLQV